EVVGAIPIRDPLPSVPGHVVEAITVRRELSGTRRAGRTAGLRIHDERKLALLRVPEVQHLLAARRELVAPGVGRLLEAAARRELPLGLCRQSLAGPLRVRQRVVVRNLHYGVIVLAVDAAARALRM